MTEKALEKARNTDLLRETKDELFIIQPMSKNNKTVFLDLRSEGASIYGYIGNAWEGGEKISEFNQPIPKEVKEIKSILQAQGTAKLGEFA
jgi:hypothetical protein